MNTLPDAPWIRAAECYGVDDGGTPYITCPLCEKECNYIWLDGDGYVTGCDKCMRRVSASDWYADMIERSRPDDEG